MNIKEWWNGIVSTTTPITRYEAFLISKFGKVISEETMFKIALEEIHSLMQSKMQNHGTSLVYDLDTDFPDIAEKLEAHFREKGWDSLILTDKIHPSIKGYALWLGWDKNENLFS